jgi:hypothetical protein
MLAAQYMTERSRSLHSWETTDLHSGDIVTFAGAWKRENEGMKAVI